MKLNYLLYFLLVLTFSCDTKTKTGIEGNNNDNNTVIITDKVEMPDEEAKKYKPNFIITSEGAGGIKLGQSIQEVQAFYSKNTSFKFITDEGARGEETDFSFPTIYVMDDTGEYLLSLKSYNLTNIDAIEVLSSKYKTYNGIHVGMRVSELSSIYGNNLILDMDVLNEVETFSPFDLNGEHAITTIYIESDNGKPLLKENAEYGKEANYKNHGRVLSILICKDGKQNNM